MSYEFLELMQIHRTMCVYMVEAKLSREAEWTKGGRDRKWGGVWKMCSNCNKYSIKVFLGHTVPCAMSICNENFKKFLPRKKYAFEGRQLALLK